MATETSTGTETTTTIKPAIRAGAPPSALNKAAVLAEMEAADIEPEKPAAKPAADKKTDDKPTEEDADVEATDDADEHVDEHEPSADKGLDKIKAAEKRMRLDIAKEREAFEREREAHKAENKQLEQKVSAFEKLVARAKYDPVAVMRALGVADEDLADVSRMIYAHSAEFAKDPKNKEAAQRMAREKEDRDRLRSIEEKQRALDEREAAREESAKTEKAIASYLDVVVRAVTEETPLVHRMLAKAPTVARADLQQIAEIMAHEGGDISEANVISMLERVMREEAEEAGFDVGAIAKPKVAAKVAEVEKKTDAAAAANGAKQRSTGGRATRDELVKKIETGDLT